MKYIRTKDGIYKVLKKPKGNYSFEKTDVVIGFLNDTKHTPIIAEKDDIIKKADTIEELCDLFVDTTGLKGIADGWRFDGYDKNKKALWWISTSETTRYISINEWNDKTAIKGAIWTNKGLIYVAQINQKGEVELL